jgi:hypothetical protein
MYYLNNLELEYGINGFILSLVVLDIFEKNAQLFLHNWAFQHQHV